MLSANAKETAETVGPPETLAKTSTGLTLALETSGDLCGAAVRRNGRLEAEYTFRHAMHLSERLIETLDRLLRDCQATLDDVTLLAVDIGPGSFTGTRIGVMTMKTLAVVRRKPLVGVSGLAALAADYAGLPDTLVVPLLPCRTGVVFASAYQTDTPVPELRLPIAAYALAELADALTPLPASRLVFCGPASARYADDLRTLLSASASRAAFAEPTDPRASQIAHLAEQRLTADSPPDDPLELTPLYIAPPPITPPKPKPIPSSPAA